MTGGLQGRQAASACSCCPGHCGDTRPRRPEGLQPQGCCLPPHPARSLPPRASPLPVPSASLLWTVCWRRCPAARRGSVLVCRGSWRAPVLCFAPSSPAWGGGAAARTLRGCRSGGAGGTGPGGRAEPSRQVEPWRPGCPAETAAPSPLPAGSRHRPRGARAAPCLGSALGLCGWTPGPPDPPPCPCFLSPRQPQCHPRATAAPAPHCPLCLPRGRAPLRSPLRALPARSAAPWAAGGWGGWGARHGGDQGHGSSGD